MGRKVYDLGERQRIDDLLAEQRDILNAEDAKSNNLQKNALKYGVIAVGVTIFVLTLKFIKDGKLKY